MKPVILVADEILFNCRIIKRTLEDNGFQYIVEATSAEDALRLFSDRIPEITIIDVNMKLAENNESLLTMLLQVEPQAKIIVSTVAGNTPQIAEALNNGAENFITKPFVITEFVDLVKKTIRGL